MSTQLSLILETLGGDWIVKGTEVPKLGPGEVLIKIHSAALNPVDWAVRKYRIGEPLVKEYPTCLGVDIAGTVEDIREGVQGFSKGDKVIVKGNYGKRNAAFQQYTTALAHLVAKIPPNISFDEAASIPLCLSTVAVGLYSPSPNFGAQLPFAWESAGRAAFSGKPILILGGSTSCGQYAIQFARMSGFSPIITTSSLHNGDLVRSLGATHVIDRKADIVIELAKVTSEPLKLILDAFSRDEATQHVAWDILASGGQLILVQPVKVDANKYPDKKAVFTLVNLRHEDNIDLGRSLYSNLTKLLADGTIKPNRIEVIPDGLRGIPTALERLERSEVSGKKLISHPQETKSI